MKSIDAFPVVSAQRRPLAACIASLLALCVPAAMAATAWPVTSCDDDGPGSLRAVIGDAMTMSGDTVDLTGLTACPDSRISLSTGEIFVMQDSLTILGPGKDVLTIDGTNLPGGSTNFNDSRIFTHKGAGTLTVQDVRLAGGHSYHIGGGYPARGGCVYSASNVTVQSAVIEGCSATSQEDMALGGGIYAKGDVTLDASVVSGNAISGGLDTEGGGIWTKGAIIATYSTISGNSASSHPKQVGGGGIYTFGGGFIGHSTVADNTAAAYTSTASGGGIFSQENLELYLATLSGNSATSADVGFGGGAVIVGDVLMTYSTIDGNYAGGDAQETAGGGLRVLGSLDMFRSTVSGNASTGNAGGIDKIESCVGCNQTLSLRDSTVSGNQANRVGGLHSAATHTRLYNSTIAFNTAASATYGNYFFGPGVSLSNFVEPADVKIHSMLISNNTYGAGIEDDLSVASPTPVTFNAGPANSLIRVTGVAGLPSGIVTGACPLLGPLRHNGGVTRTHALQSGSPAIDTGDNLPLNPSVLDLYDERGALLLNGTRNYFRISGLLPDMGAYEVQQDDAIFNTEFEGCQ